MSYYDYDDYSPFIGAVHYQAMPFQYKGGKPEWFEKRQEVSGATIEYPYALGSYGVKNNYSVFGIDFRGCSFGPEVTRDVMFTNCTFTDCKFYV